ncbi:hypothetical protein B0T14DRAFT_499040 [Immersiella caudata]|uniref:CFEM domain-containing protein n=1 Tax=Immersiella caudata TaxID=314043 RepID=A0AA40BU02_9PEZI|nr:hypothetical protein B0T14DRAFT_499040 [Immersiella caudata]
MDDPKGHRQVASVAWLMIRMIFLTIVAEICDAQKYRNYYVDLGGFPECAAANCITSRQLSPSRLGCLEANLTTDCFCSTAVTPLACAPSGPSDEDNCWFELEDWFAGVCGKAGRTAPVIAASGVPACIHDCVFFWLASQGCRTRTRNCFCALPRRVTVDAAEGCLSRNCSSSEQNTFKPAVWRDTICTLGPADASGGEHHDSKLPKWTPLRYREKSP